MYAVIKTGGKQYRVQPGDVLVVEKLDGDVGAAVKFDQVMMLGGADGGVTVGAPLIDGAFVSATLIETRRGKKVKIFKKIRRQGYRRTNGHRQSETVLRVIGLDGAGQSIKWDGEVDLTPRSVIDARARGLAPKVETAQTAALSGGTPNAETPATETVAHEAAAPVAATAEAPTPKAKKAKAAPVETNAMVEQPVSEVAADAPETSVDAAAADETGSMAAETEPKTPLAKAAQPETDDASGAGE